MMEYLTRLGYAVVLTRGMVLLTSRERPDVTLDYPSLKAAYEAQGGPARHLLYTGGRA